MEGSCQRDKHWYRCQYAQRRGVAAADLVGHPRVLGIKEDLLLDAVRRFMAERLFGPERLALLREELLDAATEGAWVERDSGLARLHAEDKQVQQALYRQSLRLEEHDDPEHPVLKLATQRIEELSGKAKAIAAEIAHLEAPGPRPHGARRSKRSSPMCLTCVKCWPTPRTRISSSCSTPSTSRSATTNRRVPWRSARCSAATSYPPMQSDRPRGGRGIRA
jgi:hypothetical protein